MDVDHTSRCKEKIKKIGIVTNIFKRFIGLRIASKAFEEFWKKWNKRTFGFNGGKRQEYLKKLVFLEQYLSNKMN